MSSFPLRIPEELKQEAAAQAEAAGISLNHHITTALASHVRAEANMEPHLSARGRCTLSGRAREILARSGLGNPPRDDDRLESE
jgi:hypothetical protein